MKTNRKLLALIIGIPLAFWIVGVCLDAAKITENLTTPLTKDVLDFWSVVVVCFLVYWIIKRKKKVG